MTAPSLYEKMKARGIDMSFYERSRSRSANAVPLDDQACSKYSIYLMRKDGSVWTLNRGEKHKKVRDTGRTLPEDQYICMHTKVGYFDHKDAMKHSNCNAPKEVI